MLTQKLLAAVGLAGALMLGATSSASANPWHGPYFRGPIVRPVYAAPFVRPVYAAPVYAAPVYAPPVVAPAYGVAVPAFRAPVYGYGWHPAFYGHAWGRR